MEVKNYKMLMEIYRGGRKNENNNHWWNCCGNESARSVNEAKTLIREAERNGIEIEVLDLDHDLGDFASQGGDAIKLLDWLAERETFYPVEIHTANPVGRANMESVLARYWGEEYW